MRHIAREAVIFLLLGPVMLFLYWIGLEAYNAPELRNFPLSAYLHPKYALVPFDIDACSIKGCRAPNDSLIYSDIGVVRFPALIYGWIFGLLIWVGYRLIRFAVKG